MVNLTSCFSALILAAVFLLIFPSQSMGFMRRLKSDPCRFNQCRNGGRCHSLSHGYFCSCPRGYRGTRCQSGTGPCEYFHCLNGGTCQDIGGWASCGCAAGYYTRDCSASVCDDIVCQNGGTCVVDYGSPNCVCAPGYQGDRCENSAII
ncbi:delta-like protein 3 [Ptychodera flava]|uniref:delta-like protein 3 n=1 Tax=Ptychodera flava TaxID=63121 RepID=UPI00396A2819